jgi:hypothetical protein
MTDVLYIDGADFTRQAQLDLTTVQGNVPLYIATGLSLLRRLPLQAIDATDYAIFRIRKGHPEHLLNEGYIKDGDVILLAQVVDKVCASFFVSESHFVEDIRARDQASASGSLRKPSEREPAKI